MLDGQELFAALLICPVADLGAALDDEDGKPVMCDITVGDVIGPLEDDAVIRVRDANFSLLSYSFSLVGPATALNPCGVGLATSPRQYIQSCTRVHTRITSICTCTCTCTCA